MSFRLGNFINAAVRQSGSETVRNPATPVIASKIVTSAGKPKSNGPARIDYFNPKMVRATAAQTVIGA